MGNYDDIINLPHHVSVKHPKMSMYNRAAQFSPFAALTGYEKARKKQEEKVQRRNAPWMKTVITVFESEVYSALAFIFSAIRLPASKAC